MIGHPFLKKAGHLGADIRSNESRKEPFEKQWSATADRCCLTALAAANATPIFGACIIGRPVSVPCTWMLAALTI